MEEEQNNIPSLEEEIEQVWSASELRNVATKHRQGWRDCLIATGPTPAMKFHATYSHSHAADIKYGGRPIENAIKYGCCRQIHAIVEKNLLMAQLSPNKYVREFAEQMIKNKKGKENK